MAISIDNLSVQPFILGKSIEENNFYHLWSRYIGHYLAPADALSARLVSKGFAKAMGDTEIWRTFYRALEIEIPDCKIPTVGCFALSNLATKLAKWQALKEICLNPSLSERIVLSTNAFKPLHSILRSTGEIVRETDPKVLISILVGNDVSLLAIYTAAKALTPYKDDPEVQEAVLRTIPLLIDLCAIMPLLIAIPKRVEILDALLARGCINQDLLFPYLENEEFINHFIETLRRTTDLNSISRIVHALESVVERKDVQQALFEKYVEMQVKQPDFPLSILSYWIPSIRVDPDLRLKYGSQIKYLPFPEGFPFFLKDLTFHDYIDELTALDPVKDKRELLTVLADTQVVLRTAAAAKLLSPFVANDPEIFEAFKERLSRLNFTDVYNKRCAFRLETYLVLGLAKMAHLKHVRDLIITECCFIDPNYSRFFEIALQHAVIKALSPFLSEPDVRSAFLTRYKNAVISPRVGKVLTIALATDIENDDIRTLFATETRSKDWRNQVVEIDAFAKIRLRKNEVEFLTKKLKLSPFLPVKAACLRALCNDIQHPLISVKDMFALIQSSTLWDERQFQEEAVSLLGRMVQVDLL